MQTLAVPVAQQNVLSVKLGRMIKVRDEIPHENRMRLTPLVINPAQYLMLCAIIPNTVQQLSTWVIGDGSKSQQIQRRLTE